ncbi:MAG: aminopeptidase [Clostridia bacterium]|nr:aminopeptidase [Clostridia bacterium]
MKKSVLRQYAALLVRVGVNIQKGQELRIVSDVEAADFVRLVAEEGYRAGASNVYVDWLDQKISRLGYQKRGLRSLCKVPEWKVEKVRYEAKTLPAAIHIDCEDPDNLRGINQEKVSRAIIAYSSRVKPYRDEMENKYQWLVAAYPGKAWAKKMFPDDRTSVAVEKLWKAILDSCMVDGINDPFKAWEKKNADFTGRCERLNKLRFDYLEYKSSNGTDFRCALMPQSLWAGGGENTLGGVYFNPNMPTEEIFTTPKSGDCEGRLVSTMPLSLRGVLVENFYIDFKDGKAVSWHAEKGEEALSKLIATDEGSCKLGELALVPVDSAISKSGLLYYNTLFDENASCHVALGAGYTSNVEGFAGMTMKELYALGVNDSMVHVDFMIGAGDLCVTGYKDGVATPVFVNGRFVI